MFVLYSSLRTVYTNNIQGNKCIGYNREKKRKERSWLDIVERVKSVFG